MTTGTITATLTFDGEAFEAALDETRVTLEHLADGLEDADEAHTERGMRIITRGLEAEAERLAAEHATIDT